MQHAMGEHVAIVKRQSGAGKHATSARLGKTCYQCQGRENTTCAMRGKIYSQCQARENLFEPSV